MKVAYIAGPYRSKTINGIVQNIRNAEKIAIKYWKIGYAVICPHKNTSLLDGLLDDDVFLSGLIDIMKKCDVVIMMKDWQKSEGAIEEYNKAREFGIEIIFDDGVA